MDATNAGPVSRSPKAKHSPTASRITTAASEPDSLPPWSARDKEFRSTDQSSGAGSKFGSSKDKEFRSTDQSFSSSQRATPRKTKFRDQRVNQSLDTARELRRAVEQAFQARPKAGPAEWAGTGVAQKLRQRVEGTRNLVMLLTKRIEACEACIRKMNEHLAIICRDRELLEPQQSTVQQRLEIRSQRPEGENIKDHFQEMLEHEQSVLENASQRLAECILGGHELIQSLEGAKKAMIEDVQFKKYTLRLEKSALQFDPYHGRDRACVLPLVTMSAKPANEPVLHGYQQDSMEFKFGATFRAYTEDAAMPEQEEGNIMRSTVATQELMARTLTLEDNVARFQSHAMELARQLKGEVLQAKDASHAGMQDSIKELFKQQKCLEKLSSERHTDVVRTKQLMQAMELEWKSQQDSIVHWESCPDVTLDRFDQRLPVTLLEDMRNMAIDRLNEQAQFSRQNMHLLQGRIEKTEGLLSQLESTLDELKENLAAKTEAWNLDLRCAKIAQSTAAGDSKELRGAQNPKDSKLALVRNRPLQPDAVERLRAKLKSAAYTGAEGVSFDVIFGRFDKDGSGELDVEEVRLAVRRSLKIPKEVVTDEDIVSLCAMLDADGSGAVAIHELVEFASAERSNSTLHDKLMKDFGIEKSGGASFHLDCFANVRPGHKASSNLSADISRTSANAKVPLSPDVLDKVRARFKAASYAGHLGSEVKSLFNRFDADGSGVLEPEEVRMALRSALRIPPSVISDEDIFKLCKLMDHDKSGHVSISEIIDFLGPTPKVSRRTGRQSVLVTQMQKIHQGWLKHT
eukprot:TRINITY_DN88743_c0_g1_i1.p1 TRINITY_DN88743_c0_g1~~TRINITY_DN88743_c0_g1_i1.p1  ORF type:complete len:802 (-),score=156.55 TRINITY_DN88743_c0_g1_i1:263-2668(-)